MILAGGGGHARVVAEVAAAAGLRLVGWCGPGAGTPSPPLDHLGDDDVLGDAARRLGATEVVLGIGDNRRRERVAGVATDAGLALVPCLHPWSWISPTAELGPGTVVMAGVVVNAGAVVGAGTILNTGSSVDHDCRIGDFAHIAPGARLAGGVSVGTGSLVGVGAAVIPGITIGERAVVGAGAAVVRDVPPGAVWGGVPAGALGDR